MNYIFQQLGQFLMIYWIMTVIIIPICFLIRRSSLGLTYKIIFFFKPEDCWIGWYYDKNKQVLYVCYLPTLAYKMEFNGWA